MLEPEIAHRDVTAVWIGGGPYDGFGDAGRARPEFNLSNDIAAANIVFASDIKVWQIPVSTYQLITVGYAELYREVLDCGELGKYLVEQLIEYNQNKPDAGYSLEWRCLGDSPAIGVVLNPGCGSHSERPAPQFRFDGSYDQSVAHRPIRVYHSIDSRFIIADLFAKLRAHAARSKKLSDRSKRQPSGFPAGPPRGQAPVTRGGRVARYHSAGSAVRPPVSVPSRRGSCSAGTVSRSAGKRAVSWAKTSRSWMRASGAPMQ
jgi:hypothetical protein